MPGNSHNQSRIVTLAKSNLHPPAAGVTYDMSDNGITDEVVSCLASAFVCCWDAHFCVPCFTNAKYNLELGNYFNNVNKWDINERTVNPANNRLKSQQC